MPLAAAEQPAAVAAGPVAVTAGQDFYPRTAGRRPPPGRGRRPPDSPASSTRLPRRSAPGPPRRTNGTRSAPGHYDRTRMSSIVRSTAGRNRGRERDHVGPSGKHRWPREQVVLTAAHTYRRTPDAGWRCLARDLSGAAVVQRLACDRHAYLSAGLLRDIRNLFHAADTRRTVGCGLYRVMAPGQEGGRHERHPWRARTRP